jgi:hypothetical protein
MDKIIYSKTLTSSHNKIEIICRAENDTIINEQLKISKHGRESIYQVVRIEIYRKYFEEIPGGYGGILTLVLISGDMVDFQSGDILSSTD